MEKEKMVGFQLRETGNIVNRFIEVNKKMDGGEKDDITKVQGWILGHLCENEENDIFQKDIEKIFNISRSTATEILKLLEKKGYIQRVAVPYDARLKKIIVTEKAKKKHQRIVNNIHRTEEKICKGISKEELEVFFAVLEKIKDNCYLTAK